MAECTLKQTAQKNFPMPKIELPQQLDVPEGNYSWPIFKIETAKGVVRITCWPGSFDCFGTADALQEARLVSAEWLPGLPGNNKTRQTILFTENGPCLSIGKSPSYCNSPTLRHSYICVIRKGKKYSVEVATTSEQEKLIRDFCKNAQKDRPAASEVRRDEVYSHPEKHRDFLDTTSRIVETAFEDREFEYTAESTARINRAIFELRQAIACAVVAPTPLYQRTGNVLMADFRKGLN